VGPVVPTLVRFNLTPPKMDAAGLSGEVIATDGPYGNLITNIEAAQFALLGYSLGDRVRFTIAGKMHTMRFVHTFSDVAKGEPLLYIDSRGRLAIAVNQGNAQLRLHAMPPTPLLFQKRNGPASRR
jgi:S-adenosylmethionine hydrolase